MEARANLEGQGDSLVLVMEQTTEALQDLGPEHLLTRIMENGNRDDRH